MRTPAASLSPNNALLVLMPDAMVRDLWKPLEQRLRPLRLEVLATTAQILRPSVMAALYGHGTFKDPTADRAPSSWLSNELSALDMAIPAVVRTPYDIDLAVLLDSWKGPSTFGHRHPGDLRSVAPAAHRCYSVLHTPDNREQTAADIATLFGPATLSAIAAPDAAQRCSIADLRRLRMPSEPREIEDPYGMVHRCVTRAAALLAYDHLVSATPRWRTFASQCAAAGPQAAEPTGAPLPTWESRASVLLDKLPGPPTLSAEYTDQGGSRLKLYEVLRRLLTPIAYGRSLCLDAEAAFAANDLFLGAWERHILRVALAFHRR